MSLGLPEYQYHSGLWFCCRWDPRSWLMLAYSVVSGWRCWHWSCQRQSGLVGEELLIPRKIEVLAPLLWCFLFFCALKAPSTPSTESARPSECGLETPPARIFTRGGVRDRSLAIAGSDIFQNNTNVALACEHLLCLNRPVCAIVVNQRCKHIDCRKVRNEIFFIEKKVVYTFVTSTQSFSDKKLVVTLVATCLKKDRPSYENYK